MKKIINFTEAKISNLSGKYKVFPKVDDYVMVLHDNSSERMRVFELNKKYILCENGTGIEICVRLDKEENEDEIVFRFISVDS